MVDSGDVQVAHSTESQAKEPQELLATETSQIANQAHDCDVVLDSIDACVGCVEGVDMQHRFEEGLRQQAVQQREIAAEHGLSEAEAAMIRLQMLDGETITNAVGSTLPDLDILNVCGNNDETFDDPTCLGVVSPTDTTLHTSKSGDKLVDSRARSARSLVDVAEEDASVDRTPSLDAAEMCAICSDADGPSEPGAPKRPTFCHLPCCDSKDREPSSNFSVCTACMLVLSVATADGASRIGRCPRCRLWIAITSLHSPNIDMSVRKLEAAGKCEACMQYREPLIEQDPPTCDACFLGKNSPLLYECEGCQGTQKIAHTLYRGQPTSASFGNEMWACNRCQKSTHWRLVSDQLTLIPAGDVPEEWGDEFLELARLRVQKARRGIAKLDLMGRDATGEVKEEGCFIL
jgi:hypothetical protein